jgi:hypothetical protein
MNGFQILDENKQPISMNEIDKMVCDFWGVELDEKSYASPSKEYIGSNWFDIVGWSISQNDCEEGWDSVINEMCVNCIGSSVLEMNKNLEIIGFLNEQKYLKSIKDSLLFFTPYVKLILLFKEKGFQPKRANQ